MDDIDGVLTRIVTNISESSLSDTEKADIYARINVGLHHLVWPIIVAHIPQYILADVTDHPEKITIDRYLELIESALQNPATPKEIHDEIKGALEEVEALLAKQLPKPPIAAA